MEIGDLIDFAPPECLGDDAYDLPWQMTRAERFTLLYLLQKFRPDVALEIGTYEGGSLHAITRYAKRVITIDVDQRVPARLAGRFSNVAFETGKSSELLPRIIEQLSNEQVGFVLIDGDHAQEAVRGDINAVLKLVPRRTVAILMHDSFMPACREGIRRADWRSCPYVHYVELDFVPGAFVPASNSGGGSMVGGFAFALLRPKPRTGELTVFESQVHKFNIVMAASGGTVIAARPQMNALRRFARHFRSAST